MSDDHFDRLSRLLDLDAHAGRHQALQPPDDGEGRALTGLFIRDEDAGLGRLVFPTFGRRVMWTCSEISWGGLTDFAP